MTSKYQNRITEYEGRRYQSMKEARYAFELDMRVAAKDIQGWESQVKIPLKINDALICNYYIDFLIYHNDDSTEYVEVKGFKTATWRLKWKLYRALYPQHRAIIIE